ncbi:N-myristoyl transferase [Rhizoclosmatium globosum]|uniref:Glycylpeptide N-tetradecanoyltransferase n=1 Tax=Rhizoclosmatium globosum TaxID=329046 RepID=A0A1Y2D0W2_9FUNG|nr:N-myristoyl transferase [Rhizoclosmatium globosum]|eukprot:ORY52933.1 N-myristoyl transferase [Rhizoclosmatium globosum]
MFDGQDDQEDDKNVLKPSSEYKFWNTQPVPKSEEIIEQDGAIEPDVPLDQIRQTPYDLNAQFEWTFVDVNDEAQLKETYQLLSENYVEDKDSTFRFDYSREFLKWAIQPPGWKKEWHLGVRVKQSQKLVAFISAIPGDLQVRDSIQRIVEINFLCIHKKLRSKRLAPVLIKEITRLVNLTGIFQAAYTAGKVIPKPVSQCRYYHRSLNFKKLLDIGFSFVPRDQTVASMIKRLKVPAEPQVPGTRAMQAKDIPEVAALLKEFLSIRADLYPVFSEEELKHWLLPIKDVVYSYVVEDPQTGKVTDFYSFYNLPSSVLKNEKYTHLRAAYLFYYTPKGMGKDLNRTTAIMKDALIQAVANNFDVFNCLDLMGNDRFLETLLFGKGDGVLNYYLYNYRCRDVQPSNMGLVLL